MESKPTMEMNTDEGENYPEDLYNSPSGDKEGDKEGDEEGDEEELRNNMADQTKMALNILLEELGLKHRYTKKISLGEILQIDKKTISDEPAKCQKSDLPWYFLKKLMMVNMTARNLNESESTSDVGTESDFDELESDETESDDVVNPLDIITALFLCSDPFVQQEITLKMSLCQFAVPLLLPNSDTNRCTLMLWAMRDIVKNYRPQSLSKGFVEDRIVLTKLPMISFVRLGRCSLSKSKILNMMLSNSQQYHDTFVHRDMQGGGSQRRISNGLIDISWYLPRGDKNSDVFGEPVAIANLHGDIASFETQFSFLCQTSAAVFVFFDDIAHDCKYLPNQHRKAQIFLVANNENKSCTMDALKKVATDLDLKKNIIMKKKKINDAVFVQRLRKTVNNVTKNPEMKMSLEQMGDIARELGVLVDEDCPVCQTAKRSADAITGKIQNTLQYKKTQLPLQDEMWKELTRLEKELSRLRLMSGDENIEDYKCKLQTKIRDLRRQQVSKDLSEPMACFIREISKEGIGRFYFLKWMQISLDNLSRKELSDLRRRYKEIRNDSQNKGAIKDIDKELSNSSLGTEHFFREMSQIYEASVFLPETDPTREQFQNLPKICAGLLLDGFPLELVDGDASNIPLRWVKDVLSQLHQMESPNNRILVITVLGVQSTGKSTLLNTMFGVQFSVSSGRCTRGAFMLLIKIHEDMKDVLKCDFMVIIDTEGLKSPQLAKLDDSYEHDNELATLVVGLSDITIVNISMENSTEMKDILQIVVHAFLRMNEVGGKRKCQFVHQNVSDVSAHEKNLGGRERLLDHLNEMTRAAAKMEKTEEIKCFTDVMDYNTDTGNWYIPGLWNGNPPMAPVNAGYSEAVYQLKKNIIQLLQHHDSPVNDISKFKGWMASLWDAVKHENFIFSFRNSLVADAYMMLCTQYNNWEWEFKESIYNYCHKHEATIMNFDTVGSKSATDNLNDHVQSIKEEIQTKLTKGAEEVLEKLKKYFEKKDGNVHLVERYKEEFANSAKTLRKEMESVVNSKVTEARQLKEGMLEVHQIKEDQTKEIEKAVCALIDECRERKVQMSENELDLEFDKMWKETLKKLTFIKPTQKDVFASVHRYLRQNLAQKGSHANQLLDDNNLKDCAETPFLCTAKGWGLKRAKHCGSKIRVCEDPIAVAQNLADSIIADCTEYVKKKDKRKPEKETQHESKPLKKCQNYSDVYIEEILRLIDESLEKNQKCKTNIEFEVTLKLNICGNAAVIFQKMHDDFLQDNDPHVCLNEQKEKYCDDFKDLFHQRDQCQKKADEFTRKCLKPAVQTYVYSKLGPDIIGEMKKKPQFAAREYSQHDIKLGLLEENSLYEYKRYIGSYENYVKDWIVKQIKQYFSKDGACEVTGRHLETSISSIQTAIHKAKTQTSDDLKTFIKNFCQELGDMLVIPQDALQAFMILNEANQEQFAHWFTKCVENMEKDLTQEFEETPLHMKIQCLDITPQDVLFKDIIGCGEQCPFCAVPCVAGGKDHTQHFAKLHRPEGLKGYKKLSTGKLVTDICTSSVASKKVFRCTATKDKFHPFKKYRGIFPNWIIPADGSFKASNYWKYVMVTFNEEFAKAYDSKPADIPPEWEKLSRRDAKESLDQSLKSGV